MKWTYNDGWYYMMLNEFHLQEIANNWIAIDIWLEGSRFSFRILFKVCFIDFG